MPEQNSTMLQDILTLNARKEQYHDEQTARVKDREKDSN
jgi:hypothetical protein